VGLLDVPVDSPRNALSTQFLGREALFSARPAFSGSEQRRPVVLYSMGVDRKTGHRHLDISDPLTASSEQALLDTLAGAADRACRAGFACLASLGWRAEFLSKRLV